MTDVLAGWSSKNSTSCMSVSTWLKRAQKTETRGTIPASSSLDMDRPRVSNDNNDVRILQQHAHKHQQQQQQLLLLRLLESMIVTAIFQLVTVSVVTWWASTLEILCQSTNVQSNSSLGIAIPGSQPHFQSGNPEKWTAPQSQDLGIEKRPKVTLVIIDNYNNNCSHARDYLEEHPQEIYIGSTYISSPSFIKGLGRNRYIQ